MGVGDKAEAFERRKFGSHASRSRLARGQIQKASYFFRGLLGCFCVVQINKNKTIFWFFFKKKLFLREADIIARGIVELILSGVKTPRRSPSPDNLKLIEDQVFTNKNQSVYFFFIITPSCF